VIIWPRPLGASQHTRRRSTTQLNASTRRLRLDRRPGAALNKGTPVRPHLTAAARPRLHSSAAVRSLAPAHGPPPPIRIRRSKLLGTMAPTLAVSSTLQMGIGGDAVTTLVRDTEGNWGRTGPRRAGAGAALCFSYRPTPPGGGTSAVGVRCRDGRSLLQHRGERPLGAYENALARAGLRRSRASTKPAAARVPGRSWSRRRCSTRPLQAASAPCPDSNCSLPAAAMTPPQHRQARARLVTSTRSRTPSSTPSGCTWCNRRGMPRLRRDGPKPGVRADGRLLLRPRPGTLRPGLGEGGR